MFATKDDLTEWLPEGVAWEPEADTDRVLKRASEVVADAVTSGYTVDDAGNPRVATVRDALRDATCAQVEQWLEVGEENDIAGLAPDASTHVGGLSLSRLPTILAPRAHRILRAEGLIGGGVAV